jgi:formylglycine-generating enzyme required for sulfatase activity
LLARTDNSGVDDPVILSWHAARKFTAWLSITTGHAYRLLKSDEWEFVAQSIGGADKGITDLGKAGLEWTADCWPADTLLLKIADMMNEGCAFRIVRDGQRPAWKNGARGLARSANVGFRVVKEN